ncbi:MAG: HlyD family type I secretion periplasmic adaptor subunit [bacterium]
MLKKIFSKDDSYQFKPAIAEIEDEPVSPLGRFVFWIVVTIIFFFIIWTSVGQIDIVVSARGKVIPDGEIKVIQPLDSGVVGTIHVREGDFVKKGQPVIDIDPSTTKTELTSLEKSYKYISLEIERLKALTEGRAFTPSFKKYDLNDIIEQEDVYNSLRESISSQLAAKHTELSKTDEQIRTAVSQKYQYRKLLGTASSKEKRLKPIIDIIPKDDYDKVADEITTNTANIQSSNYKVSELSQQKRQIVQEMGYLRQNFRSELLKELADKTKQSIQLKAQLDQSAYRNKKQVLTAPDDGYINELFVHTKGGVVTPAQKLISMYPSNSPLLIKATVLNKDIGFIRKNMDVSIKVDTFDFQKYGLLGGKVTQIAKDSIDDKTLGPVYEVYIVPEKKEFKVEGKRMGISSGMSLTAEIKTGKRRIIEFFIYPLIKYLNEGMSVR